MKAPPDLTVECEGTAVLGGLKFFREGGGGVVASRRTIRPGREGSAKVKIPVSRRNGRNWVKEA